MKTLGFPDLGPNLAIGHRCEPPVQLSVNIRSIAFAPTVLLVELNKFPFPAKASYGRVDGSKHGQRSDARSAPRRRNGRGDRRAPCGALPAGRRPAKIRVRGDRGRGAAADAWPLHHRHRRMAGPQHRVDGLGSGRARSLPLSAAVSGGLDGCALSGGDDPDRAAPRRRDRDAARPADARTRHSWRAEVGEDHRAS
jgi:hypothetical protein